MIKENHSLIIKTDRVVTALICVLWSYETLIRYIGIIIGKLPIIGYAFKPIFGPLLVIFLLVISIKDIVKYLNIKDILFGIVVVIVSLTTLIISTESTSQFEHLALGFLTTCFPMYYLGKVFVAKQLENNNLINILTRLSVVCVCASLVVAFLTGINFDEGWMSTQYLPYLILPHLLLIMISVFEHVRPVRLGILVLGLFYLIMLGNRGSVVCFLVMLIILIIHKTVYMKPLRRFLIIVLLIAIALIMLFTDIYDTIFYGLYTYANTHGMSTRVFLFFLGDFSTISLDSGRVDIQHVLIQAVKDNPFGYGLASDRFISGFYAHNVFLEILVEFGVVAGGLIIAVMVIKIFKALKKVNVYWKVGSCVCLLFCVGFFKLLISGSYLSETYFWAFIGMVTAYNQIEHNSYTMDIVERGE